MENTRRKRYFFILFPLFILAEFFISPARAEQTNHVVISEIQAGTENGADDEFVELYNPTNQEINLTGWELRKKNSSGNENNLVSSKKFVGTIGAKHFFLIAHENYKGNMVKDLVYSANSNNLSYDNNSVILYDSNGQSVDEWAWVQLLKGQSLERKAWINDICVSSQSGGEFLGNGCDTGGPNDFEIRAIPHPQNSQSAAEPFMSEAGNTDFAAASNNNLNAFSPLPSPASVNQPNGPEPEFSDKIIISEILPNPAGADKDGEWIELANIGGNRVNLQGWILEAKTKSGGKGYIFSGDNFIGPNGYLLVKRSQSNLVLANTGGEVNLLFPPDKNLSSVFYGAAKEGQSYALINGVWQWTTDITPGEKNILTQIVPGSAGKTSIAETNAEAGKENAVSETVSADNASVDVENGIDAGASGGVVVTGQIIEIAGSQEKVSSPDAKENDVLQNDNFETSGQNLAAAEVGAISAWGSAGEPAQTNNNETKNDPWFWGDMILSALSLFLVWRYQELKKRIKQQNPKQG